MKMSLEEVRQHVPGIMTEDMLRFARDEVFDEEHYIFVTCVGKNKTRRRMAHCTHCGHDFSGGGLMHKERVVCPQCHFKSRVFYAWFSRRMCVEYGSMLYWQKSAVDANAVTAIKLNLRMDMGGDIALIGVPVIETKLVEMFVFVHGKGAARYTLGWSGWYKTEAVRNPLTNDGTTIKIADYTFHASVAGTNFERMGVRKFNPWYSIECMDMASRWPSFEYINKLGFEGLLEDKMRGVPTFGAINWNGKSIISVLGLTKADVQEIKKTGIKIDFCTLYLLRRMRKRGKQISVCEASKIAISISPWGKQELDEMFKIGDPRKQIDYYKKQLQVKDERGLFYYYWPTGVHNDYKDYRNQCIMLGLDLNDSAICWPADLHQAHQNLTVQVKYKENAELEEMVKHRAKQLRKYEFSSEDILMRPFVSEKEIIDEGMKLSHCVGMYVKRYAEGQTILCALRRSDDPDTPWHTAEFTTDGRLVQCRGLRNQTSEEDKPLLKAFWAAFKEHRTKKERKSA